MDGWTEWSGGERPVDARAVVDITLASGVTVKDTKAGSWLWGRAKREGGKPNKKQNGGEIVAYRVLEEVA